MSAGGADGMPVLPVAAKARASVKLRGHTTKGDPKGGTRSDKVTGY